MPHFGLEKRRTLSKPPCRIDAAATTLAPGAGFLFMRTTFFTAPPTLVRISDLFQK